MFQLFTGRLCSSSSVRLNPLVFESRDFLYYCLMKKSTIVGILLLGFASMGNACTSMHAPEKTAIATFVDDDISVDMKACEYDALEVSVDVVAIATDVNQSTDFVFAAIEAEGLVEYRARGRLDLMDERPKEHRIRYQCFKQSEFSQPFKRSIIKTSHSNPSGL